MTVTTTSAHVAATAAIYEAFGRGDLPSVLDRLADDVSWDGDWLDNFGQRTPMGHFLPRRGHVQVADFFALLATATLHDFQVQALMADDTHVVARVLIDVTFAHGGRVRDEELHLWTFGPDGKVRAVRHYLDTAKHLAAAAGEDTTRH